MDDGVEQQTERIDENMPLLALDLLARIVSRRIDAGPPCMGTWMSRAKTWYEPLFFFLSACTVVEGKPSADADRPRESGGGGRCLPLERNTTRGGARFDWR